MQFKDDILSRPSSDLCVEGYADAAEAVIRRGCYLARTACPVPVRVRVVIPAYYCLNQNLFNADHLAEKKLQSTDEQIGKYSTYLEKTISDQLTFSLKGLSSEI
jgi:hypothetical protein